MEQEQTGAPLGAQTLNSGYNFVQELTNKTSFLLGLWMVDLNNFLLLQFFIKFFFFYQFSLFLHLLYQDA